MLNKLSLITIITPTYNRKELLEKAILSLLNQKKNIPYEFEYFIIDDGSNDGTREYIQKYLDRYDNIKYFYQENTGVGKARNVGLNNMSKNSDYLIFLDSDDELVEDCIYTCLKKWDELLKLGSYNDVWAINFFCKTDKGNFIGKNFLANSYEKHFSYEMYLSGNYIKGEAGVILKSSIFLNNNYFRFDEDIINEYVLWSKILKWSNINNKYSIFINYIGRIYGTENSINKNKITKSILHDRFLKNAIGNERVLFIIGIDLIKLGFIKSYADYLFRIGINYILYGNKNKGLMYIYKSLKHNFNLKILVIFVLSILSRNLVLVIYKLYI